MQPRTTDTQFRSRETSQQFAWPPRTALHGPQARENDVHQPLHGPLKARHSAPCALPSAVHPDPRDSKLPRQSDPKSTPSHPRPSHRRDRLLPVDGHTNDLLQSAAMEKTAAAPPPPPTSLRRNPPRSRDASSARLRRRLRSSDLRPHQRPLCLLRWPPPSPPLSSSGGLLVQHNILELVSTRQSQKLIRLPFLQVQNKIQLTVYIHCCFFSSVEQGQKVNNIQY